MRRFLTPLIFLAGFLSVAPARADFLIRDGDTVAFLGDSITAARGYPKIVELYTLMRYPERKVRFLNAGQGGDTAFGSLERLERDVFSKGATVVTVAFGINDIGWGTKANPENRQKYLDGIRTIVTRCQERKVRPVICSAAITAEAPDKAEKEYLQGMTDEGLALAKSLGAETIDLQRGMREIQRRIVDANRREPDESKHSTLHAKDGVHLSDLGQLAMGFSMLKGLGAPPLVSSGTIDAATMTLSGSEGCTITELQRKDDGLSFVRLDQGLPMNLGVLSGLNYRFIPVPEGLNQYRLTVSGLPEGKYEITACGRKMGEESAAALAKGVNMASMTANGWEPGGLWNAQSDAVKELVDARDKLRAGGVIREKFAAPHPESAALADESAKLDSRLTEHMRHLARPVPYRIEIRKLKN
ncbi:MAG: SGNH/GDSL hydrolase family protein [Verrucomicrobiota bacterium]